MTLRKPRRPSSTSNKIEKQVEENIERAIELEKAIEDITEAFEKTESLIEEVDKVIEKQKNTESTRVFLGDEDRRLLKKFNKYIVNKLGIAGNRSFKI